MKMLQILVLIGISCLISGYKIPPPLPPMPPLPSLPDTDGVDGNCPMCVPMLCNDVADCKHGVKKDKCNCCDICVKMEGESCGGPHSLDGVCDKDHTCSIRHPKSHKNMLVFTMEEKYGKCEHDKCVTKQCGMHQWCKMTNGLAVCQCEEKCKDADIPICGRVNGVQYKNPCELRKAECKTQEHIGANFGQCQKCFDDKTDTYYNSGKIFDTQTECEKRICRNGKFTYGIDDECLAKKGFSCSLQSTIHEDNLCNHLQYCEILQRSSDLDKYPHVGKCRNASIEFCFINGKKYNAGERFVDEQCSGSCICRGLNSFECVSLCPPEGIMCNEDEVESSVKVQVSKKPICYCPRPTCVKKSEICKMDKIPGDCYASIRRWYHDVNDGKCKMFIFGGCGGNKNNFYSKEACESACIINDKKDPMSPQTPSLNPNIRVPKNAQASPMVYTGDSAGAPGSETIGAPGSEETKPWTWPVGSGRKTPLSEKTMTVYGHVKFVGKMQILPVDSCMVVSFKDVTRMDSMATTLKTMKYDVSKFDTRNLFTFSMSTLKPLVNGYASYSIKADVFVGRCESQNSIQKGDYLTTKRYSIVITEEVDSYKTDITTELYGYDEPATKSETDVSSFEKTPALYYSDTTSEKEESVDETGFPDATNPGPKLTDETMRINGELVFNKVITFKSPSCLRIKLVDTSLMDVSYAVISETVLNMTNVEVNQIFKFVLESPKPSKDEYWRTYSLKAVLNNGWCFMDGSDQWIAGGDFYNDYAETITITDENIYFKKINVVKYGIRTMKSPPKPTLILDDVIVEGLDIEDEEEYVAETGFPDATNPGPRLTNETMTINGVLKFSKDTTQFPSPSCLHIEFVDTSLMDVAYALVSSKSINMNNIVVNKTFEFQLESLKPVDDDLSRVYSLKIVLNNGWCSNNDNKSTEWIRVGDYLNDYQVNVDLTKEDNEYSLTIPVMCYGEEEPVFPIIPDEADELTKEKILGNETMIVSGFVQFMDKPGIIQNNSCLLIKIQDITAQDISAVLIQTKIYPLSLFDMKSDFHYTIRSRKPMDEKLRRSFSISAVLNHGWCASDNKDEWIRQGDYVNDFNVELNITTDSNIVERNISVVCYDCYSKNTNETSIEFVVPDIPKMGDSRMKIEGNILFDTTLGLLPNSSCVHIMFLDVTTTDESIILATSVLDVSETYVKKSIRYAMETYKPVDTELWRSFEITATLNKGWCPKPRSEEWIKSGDYLSETSVMVEIKENEDFFIVNIPLTEYAVDNESKTKFVSFDEGLINITKKELNKENQMNITKDKQYDACKSRGQTYQHGESYYQFPCENCKCNDGIETCSSVECLPLEDCENPINLQDACCPVCNDPIEPKICVDKVNGKNMTHLAGEKWSPDPCTFCECDNGNIICAMMSCAGCSDHMEIVNVPGKCCPECKPRNITCMDKNTNTTYLPGDKWKANPCSDCECTRMGQLCSMMDCLPCSNTGKVVYVKDRCCPKCIPQPAEATCVDVVTKKTYSLGDRWKANPCSDCECTRFGPVCSIMDCMSCKSTDKIVIEKDQCCPKCIPQPAEATCVDVVTKQTYSLGEQWKPDACADCECTDQGSLCSTLDCLPCSNTDTVVYEKDKCCPKCIPKVIVDPPKLQLQCVDKKTNKTYKDGERYVLSDGCTQCGCLAGFIYCASPQCVIPRCPNGDISNVKGVCCPVCSTSRICVDTTLKKTYVEGNIWQNNMCKICSCKTEGLECEEPNYNVDDCDNVVRLSPKCAKICLKDRADSPADEP